MDNTEEQRIISFCTGYGGLDIGVKRACPSVRTVAYCEIEGYAVANLVAKVEEGHLDAAPIWTNLKTFPARKFRGRIHGIIAGYPCQPFSQAGKRKGANDPRHLWPHIRGIVATTRPLWCFFENVEGHISLGFREVQQSLRRMGYSVEAGIYSAAEVGASHQRKRLFILAYNVSYGLGVVRQLSQANDGGSIREGHIQGNITDSCGRESSSTGENISEELADSYCSRNGEQEREVSAGRDSSVGCSEELGNARLFRQEVGQEQAARTEQPSELGDSEKYDRRRIRRRGETLRPDIPGVELAYPNSERGQLSTTGGFTAEQVSDSHNIKRWPARPGQPQYEWEEPRTIKPGVGLSAYGVTSLVDELRLCGNGVVPDQAAKAFTDLCRKMMVNT